VVLTHPIFPTLSDAPPALPVVALVVYLAPSVVALTVSRERSRPVLVINLLLGWTLIGWALSLWMALERYRASQLPRDARATAAFDGARGRVRPPFEANQRSEMAMTLGSSALRGCDRPATPPTSQGRYGRRPRVDPPR
jgi:hypothetical protein